MKKNIQINLFGALYNIDEDAYQLLDNYLESMRRYFSQQEGGAEIADDIEHRVAELLWVRKEAGMEAVSNDVIREIIAQIGNPEEIDPEENHTASAGERDNMNVGGDNGTAPHETGNDNSNHDSDKHTSATQDWKTAFEKAADGAQKTAQEAYDKVRHNTQGKKLYRDPNDKIIGGVCSGLAKFFGGDVVLWRVILIALFILEGFGLILYAILWLVVPKAVTPEDRLRMTGQPVNPDTLNSQILEDQHIPLTRENNNGCLKALLILAVIFIVAPLLIALVAALFGGLVGLGGGIIGGIFGLIGAILGGIAAILGGLMDALGHLFFGRGDCLTEYCSNTFNAPLFWSGVIMLLIALILIIYSIIHAARRNSKPLSGGAKILIALIIVACCLLGGYNINRSNSYIHHGWRNGISISTELEKDMEGFKDDMRNLEKEMRMMEKEIKNELKEEKQITIKSDTIADTIRIMKVIKKKSSDDEINSKAKGTEKAKDTATKNYRKKKSNKTTEKRAAKTEDAPDSAKTR